MPPKVKKNTTKKNAVRTSKTAEPASGTEGCPVVGIGASAGGLETLEIFFSKMPEHSGMAFVIIQHLSPTHKSIMAELLTKHTRMIVRQIEDSMAFEPNQVYLNPPDKNVALFNGRLHLLERVKSSAINMPIDFFFRSLAEDRKEKAIGIILSGTASDGTLGIKAIKGEGGMVMVQDPETAKYDGMPRNAVATGLVDFILPVEKMPEILSGYVKHPFLEKSGKIKPGESQIQYQLQKIFVLIRGATGHDFSHYKQSTLQRRIERRLAVHQIGSLHDYILFLQKNTEEIDTLFKNLVIGVTSFFRDAEAYQVLEQEVLPALLNSGVPDRPLRFWVVGCSTGEEAYSVSIIITEVMERMRKHFDVQIFATDIDAAAIEFARKGVYPESIAVDVSKKRLDQFFIKDAGVFKVKQPIRDRIVFSQHSVIKDPPFSRLDLVTCRNLMIYLDSTLQKKILPMFHYTLNPEGILFLGTSESIGENTDLFLPLNSKMKIFRHKKKSAQQFPDFPLRLAQEGPLLFEPGDKSERSGSTEIQTIVDRAILEEYAFSGVLIDDKYEILHFAGKTENYMVQPTGRPSFNILHMAREDIRPKLITALHQAVRDKKSVFCKNIRIPANGSFRMVDITVKPLTGKGVPPGSLIVFFADKTPADISAEILSTTARPDKQKFTALQLEQELHSTREYLHATIEELETSNEELKSANEEMQSVNEELQSTNEELETSKEELQSTNEELATVNAELQNKVDQLFRASDDMNNLMSATEIASLFLDTQLCIKRYTPATTRIINLIHTDIGRPLNDLKTSFADVNLVVQAATVLKDLNTLEIEILSNEHVWYALKIIPYRTMDNVIEGVVMVFMNIHTIKQADKFRRFAAVLQDANDAITVQDFNGKILAWNKGAEQMYGWREAEALKMNIDACIPKDKVQEMQLLIGKLKRGEIIKAFMTQRMTRDGNLLKILLTATALTNESGLPVELATTERDIAWLTEESSQGADEKES